MPDPADLRCDLIRSPFPPADTSLSGPAWEEFKHAAPATRACNRLIAGAYFRQKFHRWPLPPRDPGATVNDFIFNRMIGLRWSALQRSFVDKESAKAEARKLVPELRVPETLMVLPMETIRSADHLFELLRPHVGTDSIAKPTHASGAVTFMRDVTCSADLAFLHELASTDYAFIMREMQYRGLPKKIIVERMVPTSTASPPDDYKFHCVHGKPLVCQVDHNRFGPAWSRLFCVPEFDPMHGGDGLDQPKDYALPAPDRLASMMATARALAAPFDFVRVDLYDGADGVYFGELTFTPGGSLGVAPSTCGDDPASATHRVYSRIIMTALKKAHPAGMSRPASSR